MASDKLDVKRKRSNFVYTELDNCCVLSQIHDIAVTLDVRGIKLW